MALKVLIVEDEESLSQLICMALTKLKYDVVVARTGDEAQISLNEKEKPNLILLDLLIPGKNGFEILRYIKENKALEEIPVVVLTNYTEETAKTKALELGATAFLLKTDLSFTELPDIVQKYLQRK